MIYYTNCGTKKEYEGWGSEVNLTARFGKATIKRQATERDMTEADDYLNFLEQQIKDVDKHLRFDANEMSIRN